MKLLIFYLCLALGVSFMCSLLEATLLSISHGYVQAQVKRGRPCGPLLRQFKDHIDRPLAAILTLNTIANTLGAAGVGAQVLKLYVASYGPTHAGTAVAIASGLLTLGILVFSEIIPKTFGAVYWKRIAPAAAYVINVLVSLTWPVVVGSEALGKLVTRRRRQAKFSREEMLAVLELGKAEGALLTQESRVIQNLLLLNKVRARDVLTPRNVMLAFKQNETVAHIVEKHSPLRFARIPTYRKDLDDITGVVHRYKLLHAYSEGKGALPLSKFAQPLYAVPDSKSVASILDEMIRRQDHMFLVVDEYGGTAGIITLEDAIETLLGVEIVDEFDTVEDMRELAHQIGEYRRRRREQA